MLGGVLMLSNINTKKRIMNFEDRIEYIYEKYESKDIPDEYLDLWNGFVELIEYIQNSQQQNEISPLEAIQAMKEVGFKDEDFRELILGSIRNGK